MQPSIAIIMESGSLQRLMSFRRRMKKKQVSGKMEMSESERDEVC